MRKIILSALALFIISSTCSATFIRMDVLLNTPPLIEEDNFLINVTVTNSGDEPAHDVQLGLNLPEGFTSDEIYVGTLNPNRPFNGYFKVSTDNVLPGRYPIIMKTHYADANAYPFSTIAPKFIDFKMHSKSDTMAKMENIELGADEDEGRDIKLTVINRDTAPHTYSVRMHTPNEIVVETMSQSVDVPATGEKEVLFRVKPFGAISNSAYVVAATLEYEDSASGSTMHRSFIATGLVKIVDAGRMDYIPNWLPVAALILLIAVFVSLQLKKRASGGDKKREYKVD
ncbi:MAG: hypothetical protein ABIH11_01740 [Candidatus Altiarchaeota archaeon]